MKKIKNIEINTTNVLVYFKCHHDKYVMKIKPYKYSSNGSNNSNNIEVTPNVDDETQTLCIDNEIHDYLKLIGTTKTRTYEHYVAINLDDYEFDIENLTINNTDNYLYLNRYICNNFIFIKNNKGNEIKLKGFDDTQINMTIENTGCIGAYNEKIFCVNSLVINMGINTMNSSKTRNFSVKSILKIESFYNGIISGTIERNCQYGQPSDIIMGRASVLKVTRLNSSQQETLNKYRNTFEYKKKVISLINKQGTKNETDLCKKCGVNHINTICLPCNHSIYCLDCTFKISNQNMKPPYFNCMSCSTESKFKQVMDIKEYRMENGIILF